MANLYPFIQDSLEWPFRELFASDVSLWNQYKYIAFNIFSYRILIILYKMLIITGISNEKQMNQPYMQLINKFVPLHLRALIGPQLFST